MENMPGVGVFIVAKLIDGQLARGEVTCHSSKDGLPIIEFRGARILDDGSNGAVSDLWVWPSQVISVETPAVQRSLFEVVGRSFNGADDESDHQVFWVMADSCDQGDTPNRLKPMGF